MIVDSAIYVDGRRSAPHPLEKIHEACRENGGFAWVGLYKPTEEEFDSVAGEFGLHELAVKEAIKPHQRPKIEHYGDSLSFAEVPESPPAHARKDAFALLLLEKIRSTDGFGRFWR
jgi:Mg2+ and Co2+ transporter CorA